MNAAVALWALWLFRHELRQTRAHTAACVGTLLALAAGMAAADHITTWAEDKMYQDRVVFASTSPYQRIVVTYGGGEGRAGYRLFLNGNLQFAQRDEYRYHEALVHPVMAAYAQGGGAPKKVAVLGGGDGMAVREILKYPGVESITLVELDPAMTTLFTQQPVLAQLNAHSLTSPKVKVINTDAFSWLESTPEIFDVIVVDFPDPTNFSIGKLYTNAFYALLDKHLAASGYAVIQTTSPLVARKSFWTVVSTIESVGLNATPYHTHVPSFGEWGYVVASRRPYRLPDKLPDGLRFLTPQSLPTLFDFPLDMARVPTEVNRLSNQVLVTTYEAEWGRVGR
jgi:spermidine synthase